MPDGLNDVPAIKTYMFNGLLQTPVPIARMQFYGTIGGGVYNETLDTFRMTTTPTSAPTSAAARRSRWRAAAGTPGLSNFQPARHTAPSTVQRFYAGVNLKF